MSTGYIQCRLFNRKRKHLTPSTRRGHFTSEIEIANPGERQESQAARTLQADNDCMMLRGKNTAISTETDTLSASRDASLHRLPRYLILRKDASAHTTAKNARDSSSLSQCKHSEESPPAGTWCYSESTISKSHRSLSTLVLTPMRSSYASLEAQSFFFRCPSHHH